MNVNDWVYIVNRFSNGVYNVSWWYCMMYVIICMLINLVFVNDIIVKKNMVGIF